MEAPGPEAALTSLGPYRIVSVLGRGGMGVVYLAEHEQTGERVACKTVTSVSEGRIASLRREIHALACLSHPGIVRILAEGVADGMPWYAMELIEGTTLRRWMRAQGGAQSTMALDSAVTLSTARTWTESIPTLETTERLTLAEAQPSSGREDPQRLEPSVRRNLTDTALHETLTLAWRICGPLAYLHGEGVVHRDLKPDNVFLNPDGYPVLVDFGLMARRGSGPSRERLEVGGETTGTAWYMAPEQVLGDLVDARADLYSLGCMLYELVAGRPPFLGDRPVQVLFSHVSSPVRPPSDFVEGLPPAFEDLILRLLAKAASDRPGYADGVATILAGLGAQASERSPARPYLYRPQLVGREEAQSTLLGQVAELGRGRGGVVLVGGESGVGKTRLAMQLALTARREGHVVLAGECLEKAPGARATMESLRLPLKAIVDHCRDRNNVAKILGGRRAALSLIEPAILELPGPPEPPLPKDLPPDVLARRIGSDLTATLCALGGGDEGRVVLLLDDLQWADDLTLGFLASLVKEQRIRSMPLLVIGTYRAEDLPAALAALIAGDRALGITVNRLGSKDVGAMVQGMLALPTPEDPIVAPLTAHSEGNPFFVSEYLHVAVAEGLLTRDAYGRWRLAAGAGSAALAALDLPRSVLDLVAQRLGTLPPDARRVVDAAAVLGRQCDGALLSHVGGLSGDPLLGALTDLISRQVLEEVDGARLRFLHDKLREGALATLGHDARQALHLRAAEALLLEPRHRPEELADLAHHWQGAGRNDAARQTYVDAARLAFKMQLLPVAISCYQAALALFEAPSPESIVARTELSERILLMLSRPAEAKVEAARALSEAVLTGDLLGQANALRALGGAERMLGARDAAEESLRRALDLGRNACDDRSVAATLGSLGWLLIEQGRLSEAEEAFGTALPMIREQGNRRSEAVVLASLARIRFDRGLDQEASDLYRMAIAIAEEIGDRWMEAISLGNLANVRAELGLVLDALDLLDRARHLHRDVGNRRGEAVALHGLGFVESDMGRLTEAEAHLGEALALHRDAGNRAGELGALERLANLRAQRGELSEAATRYEEVLALCRQRQERRQEASVLGGLARVREEQGRFDEAAACNVRSLDIARSIDHRVAEVMALSLQATHERRGGRALEAERLFEEARGISRLVGNRHHEATILRETSRSLRLADDLPGARRLLDQARAAIPEGDLVEGLKIEVERAHLAAAAGELPLALDASRAARALGAKLRAEPRSDVGRTLGGLATLEAHRA